MDLTPYVEHVVDELAAVAETGDAASAEQAQRLAATLRSALRLSILDALAAATGEITRELAPGSVDLRLREREPTFVVTAPTVPAAPAAETAIPAEVDEGPTARINLRLGEDLKARVEQAAATAGVSINTFLVRAAAAAVQGAATPTAPGRPPTGRDRHSGWVR